MHTQYVAVFEDDGQIWNTIPPLDPQPVRPEVLALYPGRTTMEVVRPVMVTVLVLEHVFAVNVAPVIATVVSAIGGEPPLATGSTPLTSAVSETAELVTVCVDPAK